VIDRHRFAGTFHCFVAHSTCSVGDVTNDPDIEQFGLSGVEENVKLDGPLIEGDALLQALLTWLGPHEPSRFQLIAMLLMLSWVGESSWPVHIDALEALGSASGQSAPPLRRADVIPTTPVGVTVPLMSVVQLITIEPVVYVIAPIAEKGSPFGFIGCPSARVTVAACACAAMAAASANATSDAANLRDCMGFPLSNVGSAGASRLPVRSPGGERTRCNEVPGPARADAPDLGGI
jgi:hypothetical protein